MLFKNYKNYKKHRNLNKIKYGIAFFLLLVTTIIIQLILNEKQEIINLNLKIFDLDINILYLLGFLLIISIIIYFIWQVPKNLIESNKNRLKLNSRDYHNALKDYRTTNIQIIGGFFLISTAVFTYLQYRNDKIKLEHEKMKNDSLIAFERNKNLEENRKNDYNIRIDNERIKEEKRKNDFLIKNESDRNILELFQKSLELLREADNVTRLGAIYTLEKLMNIDQAYHSEILSIFCSYVREIRNKNKNLKDEIGLDIQAIINAIGKRNLNFRNVRDSIDLSNTFLKGADFTNKNFEGANFSNVVFENVHFDKSNLKNCFFWNSLFRNCYFTNAIIINSDFGITKFHGVYNLEFDQLIKTKSLLHFRNLNSLDYKLDSIIEKIKLIKPDLIFKEK